MFKKITMTKLRGWGRGGGRGGRGGWRGLVGGGGEGGRGVGGGILDSRLHSQSCKTLSQCQSLQIFCSLLKFQDTGQCAMCIVQP
jgi:hypothetical protein